MNPKLNIITAVSRPENLQNILENIIHEMKPFFDVTWYCIYDIGKDIDIIPFDTDWIISEKGGMPNDCAGGSQRNVALDRIKEGQNYFLDDDNIIYEGYGKFIRGIIDNNPYVGAVLVSQKRESGDLLAIPSYMKMGHLDMAQFLVSTELIGTKRFMQNIYESDYFFIKGIYEENKEKFLFIDKFLCHYNYLRR